METRKRSRGSPVRSSFAPGKYASSSGFNACQVSSVFGARRRSLTKNSMRIAVELKLAFERGFLFEAVAGGQRGLVGLREAVLERAVERRFAVVEKPEAALR